MDVPEIKKLSDLPSSLVTDILLRLPLETLLSCRYVCKAWDGFFTNPEFAELHLAASPIHFLQRGVEEDRAIHFGRVVKDDGKLQGQTVDFTPRLVDLPEYTYWCVNSSNGLLCLVGNQGTISVCNPLLGESVSIPDSVNHRSSDRYAVAIGFSAKEGLYKVLVAYHLKEEDNEDEEEQDKEEGNQEEEEEEEVYGFGFEIYTLGTREWRAVDTVEGCTPWHYDGMDFNTFLHGSLHWVSVGLSTDGGSRVRSLWSFNFETEKFQRIALPQAGDNYLTTSYTEVKGEDEDLHVQIGVMNGCLWVCFCDAKSPRDSDIWVMKEYGVKESWIQILGFRSYIAQCEYYFRGSSFVKYGYPGGCVAYPILLYSFSHKDVLITDEEDLTDEEDPGESLSIHVEKVLIADDSGKLACYNTKKRKAGVVEFNTSGSHTYDFGYVTAYVPSFISLQDVAKGEEVKVSRITYEAAEEGLESMTSAFVNLRTEEV